VDTHGCRAKTESCSKTDLLAEVKEYIINELGMSVTVGNGDDPGTTRTDDNQRRCRCFTLSVQRCRGTADGSTLVRDGGIVQTNAQGNVSLPFLDFVTQRIQPGSCQQHCQKWEMDFLCPSYPPDLKSDPDLSFLSQPGSPRFSGCDDQCHQ
jgi:hypothetical protein